MDNVIDVAWFAGTAWALTQLFKQLVPSIDPRIVAFLLATLTVVLVYTHVLPLDLVKLIGAIALATGGASALHDYGVNSGNVTK